MARIAAIAAALVMVVAACGGGDEVLGGPSTSGTADPPTTPGEASTTAPPLGELPTGPSALDNPLDAVFPEPLVPVSQIISGGPPPDGIPPIEAPVFIDVATADAWLTADESVVVLEVAGDVRAYPVQVLIWHEIVNDTVGGVPVSITYCPLCNSAVSYERVVRGVETTFGTSGRLFSSALVMYDRATESLWTHFDGRAVVGLLAGDELRAIPSPLLAWQDFKDTYPDGQVLDRDRTGFTRRYGANPYVGYDDPGTFPFLYLGDPDDRARAKQRVVGIVVGDDAVAYSLDAISDFDAGANVEPISVGDRDLVVFWAAGQSSALEGGDVSGARDVGSVGVFDPVVDGRELTFTVDDGQIVDTETGSVWGVTGVALEGALAGSSLDRLTHLDTFWFAWSTYRPGTRLIEA